MQIRNRGQEIIETDYWDTEYNRGGYCFLSWNAGAARLLLSGALEPQLCKMRAATQVIISCGPLAVSDTSGRWDTRDALELLFEDGSDTPTQYTSASSRPTG
jgi:hypothetical protein